jgi:hypothetical protein
MGDMLLKPWPLAANIAAPAIASIVIGVAGWRLTAVADALADRVAVPAARQRAGGGGRSRPASGRAASAAASCG